MRGCAGLDFGSIEEAHERLLKRFPDFKDGRQPKAWYLGAGYYDRKVPTWAAGVMGFVGLAVPAQASHAVFRTGEKSQILDDMKQHEARTEALPQLLIVLTAITVQGITYIFATQPILIVSDVGQRACSGAASCLRGGCSAGWCCRPCRPARRPRSAGSRFGSVRRFWHGRCLWCPRALPSCLPVDQWLGDTPDWTRSAQGGAPDACAARGEAWRCLPGV